MPVDAAPSLRRALRIVWVGVRREPRWFAFAVAGSTVYGVMTVLTAWAIGKVTREQVQPAVEAGHATAHQLWATFGWVAGVVCLNVVGVVIRRIAAGYTMYNVAAQFRREVTRQYLRLPLSWHHRHPSGQLLSNANADVEATWNVFAPLPMALGVIVMLIAGIVQMVLVDPVMAIIGLMIAGESTAKWAFDWPKVWTLPAARWIGGFVKWLTTYITRKPIGAPSSPQLMLPRLNQPTLPARGCEAATQLSIAFGADMALAMSTTGAPVTGLSSDDMPKYFTP